MAETETHWSRIGESGTLLGMKFLLLTYRLFGRWGFFILLFPVICYFYLRRGDARRASQEYLAQIDPWLDPDQRRQVSPFRQFMKFGEILLDKLLVWMGQIDLETVEFDDPDVLEEFADNGEGGLIVVSHLGNFEICGAIANQVPHMRMTILVYTRHAIKFNSMLQRFNRDIKLDVMQVTDMSPVTAMMLADRVRAGEYVVIAGDRTPVTGQDRVSRVQFLGREAPMPQGPFILAGLLKCPVYLLFCLKHQDRYHVYFEVFDRRFELGKRSMRSQRLHDVVQAYAQRLAYYCQKAPLQWFNFYSFWSAKAATEDDRELPEEGKQEIPQD